MEIEKQIIVLKFYFDKVEACGCTLSFQYKPRDFTIGNKMTPRIGDRTAFTVMLFIRIDVAIIAQITNSGRPTTFCIMSSHQQM
jgi:hypothetical protein